MNDSEFLSVPFEFEGASYHALVRKKKRISYTEYQITVMNGKLEKLLFGNHIVKQINGCLHAECSSSDKKLVELKQCITRALQQVIDSQHPEPAPPAPLP